MLVKLEPVRKNAEKEEKDGESVEQQACKDASGIPDFAHVLRDMPMYGKASSEVRKRVDKGNIRLTFPWRGLPG